MTSDDRPAGVVVVGAGPTGLALALQAFDHGATVRIVERRSDEFRPSRALIVHPRTLEVLRPLGVTGRLLARGDVAPRVLLHLRGRVVRVELDELALVDTAFPHLLLIRQAEVEAVLAEALDACGVVVERDTEAQYVRDGAGFATVHTTRGDVVGRHVVGCDGPTSVVRRAIDASWSGGPYRQEVVLADVELAGEIDGTTAHAAPGPHGVVFLFPHGEHATWRLLATRSTSGAGQRVGRPDVAVSDAEVRALFARSTLPLEIVRVCWSARVPLQHRISGAYRSGRLFIAGDAAHVQSPAGGLGMNTGILDATNLGWKLACSARSARDARDTLLESYELERRRVARRVVRMTSAIFWAEAATDPFARAARGLAAAIGPITVPVLLRRRRLVAHGYRTLGQLGVSYRRSPLSRNGRRPARGLPPAGARLPDAPVVTSAGATRRHDLTARSGVVLLAARDADPPAVPDSLPVHRLLDTPGTGIVAVRPDGYVGYSGDTAQPDELAAWLEVAGAS